MDWRMILIIALMTLSVVDLSLTYYYVAKYRAWQPEKPFKLIELNPLLVFLWTRLGLKIGMFVGSVIILSLIFIVGKYSHWSIALILFLTLCFALFNHYNNINLLHQLIEKYPSGYLPAETFGQVEGNNIQ